MAAATSILLRANEAVAKEQRLAAVTELQNRVEDWKGHQIDHFGDLMLFGTFTVLKGEGAKEVEREVRDIFFSLSPKVRKRMRPAYGPNRSLSLLSSPMRSPLPLDCRSHALVREDLDRQELANPNLYTSARLDPNLHTKAVLERTFSSLQARGALSSKRFVSGLEGVPEEVHDERSEDGSKETSSDTPPMGDVKQALPNTSRPILLKKASKPTFYAKSSLGFSLSPLQSPSAALGSPSCPSPLSPVPPSREGSGSEGSSAPPTPSRSSKGSGAGKLSDFGSKVRASKRMFKAVFKKTKPISFTSSNLHLFNGPFMHGNHFLIPRGGHLPKWPPPIFPRLEPIVSVKPRITNSEKEMIEELKLIRPVRIQYKVYLFERILLCCKEVNPNKPKNKMLGNTKPLVDKKGKLRLQLKGRIFMQNVTDVISVNRSSSYLILGLILEFEV